ncbi:T9SS type A sorting domain-containing protein [Mucilaginibacter sp.]|uniref:T9SS type A sorting domain-containing protein n=1 Tax=Mucilaginibacter sp. TaxID=1882438 RepID=UPI00284D7DE3|nr:T9SS type A sorting domain-containing protein [Mucilaginibacter sp.]MDR3696596.1 T9SS type A sorting domain-containing protein [Mucilaginibacter sp.]
MKTLIFKPGFEFIFALSLMAIIGLPPMLMAQNQKDVEIKIENGDTTINGKNIKTLSPNDRENALRDIKHLSGDMGHGGDSNQRVFVFKRRDTAMKNDDRRQMITENITINKDSLGNTVETRSEKRGAMRNRMTFKYNSPDQMPDGMDWRNGDADPMRRPMIRPEHRNTQNFTYVNTDNNDISTRISFNISDVTNDDLKKMPHIEGPMLDITDLNIVPQFSTGKTLLLFTLPSKGAAEVKLINSEGKELWTDKTTGANFTKSFVLGLNGIYYLQVKQGRGIAVKRIMKEE